MEVMAAIGGPRYFPRPPLQRVKITVVRCSVGRLDPDNLAASTKSLLDVLCVKSSRHPTGLGIIEDDNSDLLTLELKQSSASQGAGSTIVRIERVRCLTILHVPGSCVIRRAARHLPSRVSRVREPAVNAGARTGRGSEPRSQPCGRSRNWRGSSCNGFARALHGARWRSDGLSVHSDISGAIVWFAVPCARHRCGVAGGGTLWLKSWDQVPAGSLPDDDVDLCRLAELSGGI